VSDQQPGQASPPGDVPVNMSTSAPPPAPGQASYPPPAAPAYPPPAAPAPAYPPPPAYPQQPGYGGAVPPNVYAETTILEQVLTPEQRQQYMQNRLTSFPTWAVVVLHFLTIGIFTTIYQGLKFDKLPPVKHDDFGAGKAIGFLFIPFFNLYWIFRFWLSLTDRINFQFRLRGQQPAVSRGIILANCIVGLIPYLGWVVAALILSPIAVAQLQSATNRLAAERGA